MRLTLTLIGIVIVALILASRSDAHLLRFPDHPKRSVLENRLVSQTRNLAHARYVCRHGARGHRKWGCAASYRPGWLLRERRRTVAALVPPIQVWIRKQVNAAEQIGQGGDRGGTDPWPNCPDPYDHQGHSWFDTVRCENRGYWERYGDERVWLDSPGYYRCGLQFKPSWESVFGRLCP